MKKIWNWIQQNDQRRRAGMIGGFILLGALAAYFSVPAPPIEKPPETGPIELSTLIPKNHTLIPIELKNSEQLEGVLGAHGIVDLFVASTGAAPSALVAKRLRLIRAPLNPHSFAVLVRDEEAPKILSRHGPFIASLRSPDQPEHSFVGAKAGPSIEFAKESP